MTTFCRTTKFGANCKPYASNAFYAVARGKTTGVFRTWDECRNQVLHFPNARYKKFATEKEAEIFIKSNQDCSQNTGEYSKSLKRKQSSDDENTKHFKSDSDNGGKCAVVYTDGACSSNGKRGAKAGIGVYWGENDSRNISAPLDGRPTNNRAEIHAAIAAIKQAKDLGYSEIIIRTDSKFLIDSITCWVKKWQRNGWKLKNGGEVINKDDFTELISVMNGISVKWEKVEAHIGIVGNEEADRLARYAAENVMIK